VECLAQHLAGVPRGQLAGFLDGQLISDMIVSYKQLHTARTVRSISISICAVEGGLATLVDCAAPLWSKIRLCVRCYASTRLFLWWMVCRICQSGDPPELGDHDLRSTFFALSCMIMHVCNMVAWCCVLCVHYYASYLLNVWCSCICAS